MLRTDPILASANTEEPPETLEISSADRIVPAYKPYRKQYVHPKKHFRPNSMVYLMIGQTRHQQVRHFRQFQGKAEKGMREFSTIVSQLQTHAPKKRSYQRACDC
jgi:hypothetical protein